MYVVYKDIFKFHVLAFKGFAGGAIVFDAARSDETWIIVDKTMRGSDRKLREDFKVLGQQLDTNSKSILPTGLQTWQLFDENCEGTRTLMLSSVSTMNSYL